MRILLLASHGSLAEGMLSAVRMILNQTEGIYAYGLDTYEDPQTIYDAIHKLVLAQENVEFIILTDINGGSVHNQLMQLCIYKNVYLQTGMNLSMVLEIALASEERTLEDVIEQAVQASKDNMLGFSSQLIKKTQEEEGLW